MERSCFRFAMAICLLLVAGTRTVEAQAVGHPLLGTEAYRTSRSNSPQPRILRSRVTSVDPAALANRSSIELNLFNDATFVGIPDPKLSHGDVTAGSLKGLRSGTFAIVSHGSRLYVSVHTGRSEFSIEPVRTQPTGNAEVVMELDPAEPILCGVGFHSPRRMQRHHHTLSKPLKSRQAATEVSVLVVYSDGVAADNSAEYLRGIVERAVADANLAMRNSEIALTIHLVGVEHIPFNDTNLASDLDRVAEGPVTAKLRNQTHADLVTLVTRPDNIYYGIADLLTDYGDPEGARAFGVIDEAHLHNGYVFTHELGHCFGCQHDRANANSTGLYPFSYGQWFEGQNGTIWGTIMSYQGRRILYYSNPRVQYDGYPTGEINVRDNARTITLSKAFVAKYR